MSQRSPLILLDEGLFIGTDAKISRSATIEWQAPPEELGMSNAADPFWSLLMYI